MTPYSNWKTEATCQSLRQLDEIAEIHDFVAYCIQIAQF